MNLETLFQQFRETYVDAAVENGVDLEKAAASVTELYNLTLQEIKSPSTFDIFHERVRAPFDYYRFGIEFFSALIDKKRSSVKGIDSLELIAELVSQGENVILLANHQTEPDPQIISFLIEDKYPKLAEEMIFVAGHRVITDPVAIPFSKGRNLLCINSKRYIETPPEKKEEKILHNRKALDKLKTLLQEGGKCIYVAPAGGRDRALPDGSIQIAPFDSGSLELFRLVAKETKTHFFPFAMDTYSVMPPPESVQLELGEMRTAQFSPVHISFGKEIDLDHFPDMPEDKHEKRAARAAFVYQLVKEQYNHIREGK